MNRLVFSALMGIVATPAMAIGHLADVTIVDRDSGEVLQAHRHKGEYWVAGRPGARYAVQVRNQQGQRLLAVISVDGVNVVTGKTARFDQNGYVFDGWVGYDINGWRKSDAEVAAFTFTALPNSYAARTGRPQNVGVIGVALFPEARRQIEPLPYSYEMPKPSAPAAGAANEQSAAAAPQADQESRTSARREKSADSARLGTGHGEREGSWVTQVAFERARNTPDEVIRIRYDSRSNLVAMGIIPQHRRIPHIHAFPAEQSARYVPDP